MESIMVELELIDLKLLDDLAHLELSCYSLSF